MALPDYYNVYQKRLNRYGLNYQERVLTQRREVFERRLLKSMYRIDFEWNDQTYPATFERYQQDETKILRYLFTEYDLTIPNGTILMLPDPIGIYEHTTDTDLEFPEYAGNKPIRDDDENGELRPWMVYYLEDTGAKGYNRYTMLKMTHYLTWKDRNKIDRESYAYMYGQEDNMLKDEIQSRSRMDPIYSEALKMSFFVMPATEYLRKDDYFIIDKTKNNKVLNEFYRVTGYDIQSQDGIEYVTVDPIYEFAEDYYDNTVKDSKPTLTQEDSETNEDFEEREDANNAEYYWLRGGNN